LAQAILAEASQPLRPSATMQQCTMAILLLVLMAPAVVFAAEQQQQEASHASANPIRKVVTLLQKMQGKVTAEGKKQQELYDKFMCYCKTSGGSLSKSIEDGKSKVGSLTSALKAAKERKEQTEQDLKEHQVSRTEAEDAMATATKLREKEAAAFAKVEADGKANVAALDKAITSIDKGLGGAFLQTEAAAALRNFAMEKAELPDDSRQDLLAFLSGTQADGYVPQSGQIHGILKELQTEMAKSLAEATATENAAVQTYDELMAAKKKELATLTQQIETEHKRIGELGVAIAGMANDLEDTQDSLADDGKFLAELETGCDTKTKEWEEIKATRAEELAALAETIKVLNDDDALDLFKKTLPSASASASFVQLKSGAVSAKSRALATITALRSARDTRLPARPELDLIALALQGKKVGLGKVLAMIDKMVDNLKTEQNDDDHKKDYCTAQLDGAEDKTKELEHARANSETAIEEMQGSIAALKEELAALEAGIKDLDKSVADATEQRKEEHADYNELVAVDTQAKELLLWAKNRLYKFYEPKMYKPPAKEKITEAETISANFGAMLVQISKHKLAAAPPPPPETFGAYTKKSDENQGVLAMIDLLVGDLQKELNEAEAEEKVSQTNYEEMVAEAAKKRADDSKSMTDKTSAKAAEEEALEVEQDSHAGLTKELMSTLEYTQTLHGECDWLMQNYEVRKKARSSEIDALGQAKDVLNGAGYSLVQTAKGFLAPRA